MFSLTDRPAELAAYTAFTTNLGKKEKESGLAMKFSVTMANTVLDQFAPGLAAAFYRRDDVISAQQAREDVATPEPVLRFPQIKSLPWDRQITGAQVTIHRDDLFGQEPVALHDCVIDSFNFGFLEGGSVDITFRIKAKPAEDGAGRLYGWLRKVVLLTIVPPEAATYEPQADADDDDDPQGDLTEERAFPEALDGQDDRPFGDGEDRPAERVIGETTVKTKRRRKSTEEVRH